jgi:hypothetical protein
MVVFEPGRVIRSSQGIVLARSRTEFRPHRRLLDDRNTDGLAGAGLDARRGFANGQAMVAHVALSYDPQATRVLRHLVRTLHDAVLAANALVIQVTNDACKRILLVGKHRAAAQTTGIHAVMAGGGDVLLNGWSAADEQSDTAPRLAFLEAVERVAGGDAGFATGTFIKLDFKSVLLTVSWAREWNKPTIRLFSGLMAVPIVPVRETIGSRPLAFLGEQGVDESGRTRLRIDWRRKRRHAVFY